MTDPKIRELLDACRPGSDDLDAAEMQPARDQLADDPRLAEGFARSQKLDARLSRVFREVPVPEGLADRLLDRLQAASTYPAERPAESAEPDEGLAEMPQGPVTPSAGLRRRRVLRWTVGTVAGLAAALLVAVLIRQFLPGAGEPQPDEAFRLLVQAWSKDAAAGPWQHDFRGQPLESLSVGRGGSRIAQRLAAIRHTLRFGGVGIQSVLAS